MAVKWTEEQQSVIDTREKNILVSAAAGSGKTAVLVARILAMVTDEAHPVDIDRLLVVTFTNAAAAEMRERIRDALEQRAEEEPENEHLQRQLVLVHNAKITTIHSFCLNVLRNHFQIAGIDPAFRIADEGEISLLEQDTVKEIVNEAYEESTEEFLFFLESFVAGRSDQAVEDQILELYHFSLGQPMPEKWMDDCKNAFGADDLWNAPQNRQWLSFIQSDTEKLLSDIEGQIQAAIRITDEPDGPYPYRAALESDLELARGLRKGQDYQSFWELFSNMPSYARLSAKKDPAISEEKKQQVQSMRGEIKDAIQDLRKKYYYDRPDVLQEELRQSGQIVCVLTDLVKKFMVRLTEKKAEKNVLDFGDLEHLALKVLTDPSAGAAHEYSEYFHEVMIDEYQDSNLVQELILQSVAGRGGSARNRFMVGDVKQSIYRFRLARPELFMEKYHSWQQKGEDACRIDLHKNFRSRPQVLEGINYIFRQIMKESLGGVEYDADAALYPGAVFAEYPEPIESEGQPFLEFYLQETSEEKQEEEARLVGGRIQEIVGHSLVWDKELETYRPAKYGDIVILLRTVSGWADVFGETLTQMGIPCFTGSQKGYFSAAEIRVVLSYLQILDNPLQDIPLAAVLRSPIGGLTDDELAKIRNASIQPLFYDCCREYLQNAESDSETELLKEKLNRFFAVYESLRAKCGHTPVHMLLWELLEVTGYGEYARSLPAGVQRKANLDMLVEKAIAYEATSYRGLYHFVRYIENLKKYEIDYGEANIGSEAADLVRIMSIHKSKGLEFPIVFVSGLGKQFNVTDARSRVVMHPEFGIGCDCVDTEQRTRTASLLKRTIRQKIMAENLGEELRILYVAMTRAKEKLILTGAVPDAAGKLKKWSGAALQCREQMTYSLLSGAATYLDWLVPALMHHPDALPLFDAAELESYGQYMIPADEIRFQMAVCKTERGEAQEEMERTLETLRLQRFLNLDTEVCLDETAKKYLEEVFSRIYPYEADRDIAGKLSVSELKKLSHMPEETDAQELYQPETVIPLIPEFRSGEKTIAGAARGTVYHTFMENLDYSRKEQLEMQLEELISCGRITQEEGSVLCLDDVRRFLSTKSGQRMEVAAHRGKLYREKPFVYGVNANEIRSQWSERETVLVQGIIDAWFEEGDELVVLDYKTDRIQDAHALADRYRAQLDYYADALQRLTGKKVKDRIIYSFYLGKDIVL